MPELETVDLDAVEILSAGGPIHGVGSPPEGDFWSPDQLRGMAEAATELGGEIKPPAKIGHRGGDPAVGWLENIRINDDGTKLLTDIKRVPKGLASLLKVGAYRTRSVELAKVTSQRTGKTYDWAVTGLAWLGGRIPAVRTLADVVKLYDGDAERLFVSIEEHEPEATDRLLELVLDAVAHRPGVSETVSDSRPGMKFTDEQRRMFAEATGLEEAKATDELLEAAGLRETEPEPNPDPEPDPERLNEAVQEATRELETRLAAAEKQAGESAEKLRVSERRQFVEDALRAGKVTPGQRETLEALYDSTADGARKFIAEAPANDVLGREYGSAEEPVDDDAAAAVEKAYEADIARMAAVAVEDVI